MEALRKTSIVKTVLTKSPSEAAKCIKRGGIVAFPTETVYGLGANAFDGSAIAKIFEAKQRPDDNPLIAHISDVQQIGLLASDKTESAEKFIAEFFPGPLTIVLKKLPTVPLIATAGLDTIAIRMPRFDLAHRFLTACATPIVAPSANLSGRPSPTTWQAVAEDLEGRIDCILLGEATEIGLESTVVDCTTNVPMVLRSGSISIEQLREIVPATRVYEAAQAETPRSPGMHHRHYSPKASVVIVDSVAKLSNVENAAYIGTKQPIIKFTRERICSNADEYAHAIFEFFRECDRSGVQTIYCERVGESGIGMALMDRIGRAAE